MPLKYNLYPLGDQALTVALGDSIDEEVNRHCIAVAALISAAAIPGIKDVIPAYTTVSVIFDLVEAARHSPDPSGFIHQHVSVLLDNYEGGEHPQRRTIEVPACFEAAFAPDLPGLAAAKNLPADQLINIFTASTYRVYMIGFLPGFAYMGKVDDAIAMGRKKQPHLHVDAGSIGIAGNQTGIYPLPSPGGWNIIGRTPLSLFESNTADPCLLRPGDTVTFRQITMQEFDQINMNR